MVMNTSSHAPQFVSGRLDSNDLLSAFICISTVGGAPRLFLVIAPVFADLCESHSLAGERLRAMAGNDRDVRVRLGEGGEMVNSRVDSAGVVHQQVRDRMRCSMLTDRARQPAGVLCKERLALG